MRPKPENPEIPTASPDLARDLKKPTELLVEELGELILKTALWCSLSGFIGGAGVGVVLTLAYLGATR